jgi:hypothetical protein
VWLTAAAVGSVALCACARTDQTEGKAPSRVEVATSSVAPSDDRSLCDYRSRTDREVVETASPNSVRPNIRRVYGIVGQGDDARRVLLCRELDTNLDGIKDVVRTYDDNGEPLHELADTDYDGRIDTWITFAGGRISEVKISRSSYGRPDERRVYLAGRKVRAELDDNFDGKTEVVEIYDEGHLARRGVDLNGDGKIDRWESRRAWLTRRSAPRPKDRSKDGRLSRATRDRLAPACSRPPECAEARTGYG